MHRRKLLFLFVFFLTYFFLCSLNWLHYKLSSGIVESKSTMQKFIAKYESDIQLGLFGNIYNQAQTCLTLKAPAAKQLCENQSGLAISKLLKEEELTDKNGNNWPNDLFFVKKVNQHYLRIGWDGKLTDITSEVDDKHTVDRQKKPWFLFGLTCNTFGSLPASTGDACEIYETISLANGDTGYMVRVDAFTEEDLFIFYIFLPLFSFYMLQDFEHMGQNQIEYVLASFLSPLISFTCAYIAYTKFLKPHKKTKN